MELILIEDGKEVGREPVEEKHRGYRMGTEMGKDGNLYRTKGDIRIIAILKPPDQPRVEEKKPQTEEQNQQNTQKWQIIKLDNPIDLAYIDNTGLRCKNKITEQWNDYKSPDRKLVARSYYNVKFSPFFPNKILAGLGEVYKMKIFVRLNTIRIWIRKPSMEDENMDVGFDYLIIEPFKSQP